MAMRRMKKRRWWYLSRTLKIVIKSVNSVIGIMFLLFCGNPCLYERGVQQNGFVKPKSRIRVYAIFASQALNKAISAV